MRDLNSAHAQSKLVAACALHYDDLIDFSQTPGTHMPSAVLFNEEASKPGIDHADAKTASLWERMMAVASRSFELLADSKARFPLDM
jgi:hypothetical protein